jgi:tRNA-uridine 2-sulfurtransferase
MKVLVGMSGGVDSSVAAALLLEQGYEVIGVTLKLYDYAELDFEPPDGGCCSLDLINDARAVCAKLGVSHYVIDLQESFRKNVIEKFVDLYSRGRTPNPCIDCNRFLKWGEMLSVADKLGCDYIATGHYARIERIGQSINLLKARDNNKDQSYALWGIGCAALARTLLPVGEFTKPEIREIAQKYGFRNANRPDSQDICFVPTGDYASIVKRIRRTDDLSFQPGPILDTDGKKIGEHKGYAYYTIGQRRGFGIAAKVPLYVTRINPADRSITVGVDEALFLKRFSVIDINLLTPDIPETVTVKIRYKHQGSPARVQLSANGAIVSFMEPERAITPGQSAVFYDGERVLGGGIIDKLLN